MALPTCPFYNLLLRETEPEQKFFSHAAARLENLQVDLSLFRRDQSLLDAIELRPTQILSRLVKLFEKLEKKSPPLTVSIGIFANVVSPLLEVRNSPFSLDQYVELVGSALPLVIEHPTTYLREIASFLMRKEGLLESLLANWKYASVMQRWLGSRQNQQVLGQELLEKLTEKTLALCEACSGDHGTTESHNEWESIHGLLQQVTEIITASHPEKEVASSQRENILPLHKMRRLGEDEKKTNQARQEKQKVFELPPSFETGLKNLQIMPPQGVSGLSSIRDQLQGRVPQLICTAINSFPCRLCTERMVGNDPAFPVKADEQKLYAIPPAEGRINLYGERVGAWKVLLSDLAMSKIKRLIQLGMFVQIERGLRDLAQGNWKKTQRVPHGTDSTSVPLVPTRFAPLGKVAILWQVDAGYYDEMTERQQFGQTIKVWDVVSLSREELLPAVDRIINLQRHYNEDQMDVCNQPPTKLPDGTWVPQRWEFLPAYNSCRCHNGANKTDQALIDLIGKSTNVTESCLRALSNGKGYEEFPFDLSQEEVAIVNHTNTSSLILGRSGTGKTTCLLFKLFAKYEAREAIHHSERIRQLLLTRSPHLAAKLKTYARNLIDTGSGTTMAWIPPEEEPNQILKLQMAHFPFVCTYEKFLGMVENSMRNADRQKFADDRQAKSRDKFYHKSQPPQKAIIDFQIFKYEYWGSVSGSAPPGCPSELIFAEIMGVIRGSRTCAQNLRPLLREEYVPKGSRVSPAFPNVADREKVFDIYERYEKLKKQRGQIDDLDRVMYILKYIAEYPKFAAQLRGCFEEIYVDEIQDLRCVDVVLLFKAVFNARGIHLAGDTAQCISKDSVFRFPEIRAAFFDEHESTAAFLKQNVAKPGQFMLARNYRSHQGILSFASWVMQVLWSGFPETIDKLSPEIGQLDGPVPILFAGFDCSVLSSKMIGVVKMDDKVASFGAEQVILVRDEHSRAKLQAEIGDIALVLTILESKGMEFDDVLIYDFFGGSGLGSSYRCLYLLAQEPRGDFDSRKHAALCAELKQLYVAVTRARKQLWLMESIEGSVEPLAKALAENECLNLFDIVRKKDETSAKKLKALRAGGSVDPMQWKQRAMQLFDQMNYQAAIFCYNKAGDSEGADRAEAYHLRREGRSLKFTDSDGSVECFEKAIVLFLSIKLLEDAAECYEQVGKHDKAAEIWKEKGQLQRAAKLYELGKLFKDASECYDSAGDFEKAVEALRQGSEFDELISYLDRSPEKLDTNIRQRYSRLCNILLRQGRISSNLRAATINLLGSGEEKVEFFKEFEMMDELYSYYAANERWIDYYETSLTNGDVMAAVDCVIEHDLIEKVDIQIFEEAIHYAMTEAIYVHYGVIEKDSRLPAFPLWKRIHAAFSDTKLREVLSRWRRALVAVDFDHEDALDLDTLFVTGDGLLSNLVHLLLIAFRLQGLLDVTNTEKLPLRAFLRYANLIQDFENDSEVLSSLHLACGIYNRDRYGKSSIKLRWSPLHGEEDSDENNPTEDLTAQAMRWAKDIFTQAMTVLNARARSMISQQFPRHCHYFLLRGVCSKLGRRM